MSRYVTKHELYGHINKLLDILEGLQENQKEIVASVTRIADTGTTLAQHTGLDNARIDMLELDIAKIKEAMP